MQEAGTVAARRTGRPTLGFDDMEVRSLSLWRGKAVGPRLPSPVGLGEFLREAVQPGGEGMPIADYPGDHALDATPCRIGRATLAIQARRCGKIGPNSVGGPKDSLGKIIPFHSSNRGMRHDHAAVRRREACQSHLNSSALAKLVG